MAKNEYICDCAPINQKLVEQARRHMPHPCVLEKTAQFYKILGDVTRCRLICALLGSELCVCDLANVLSMTKSAVSHQLSKMLDAGVVRCRREGKHIYYSLEDAHVQEIVCLTVAHIHHCH